MAGAAERLKQLAQQQFQQAALQVIDGLDKGHDAFVERVLNDLREIKAHPERAKDLDISDGDYQLKPQRPQFDSKGKSA